MRPITNEERYVTDDNQFARTARNALAILNDTIAHATRAGLRCDVSVDEHQQFTSDEPMRSVVVRIYREVK